MLAFSTAAREGVKVTETLQLAPMPRVEPQVLELMAKSAALVPVRAMDVMLNIAVPLFVSCTVEAAEVVLTV